MGITIWMIVTILGLAALLKVYPFAYQLLEFAGACFLLKMGYGIIRPAIKEWQHLKQLNKKQEEQLEHELEQQFHQYEDKQEQQLSNFQCFVRGFIVNILNPKCALFFITVIPQFIKPELSLASQFWALYLIHILIGFAYWTLLAIAVNALVTKFSNPRFRVGLELGSGIILSCIALSLFIFSGMSLIETIQTKFFA